MPQAIGFNFSPLWNNNTLHSWGKYICRKPWDIIEIWKSFLLWRADITVNILAFVVIHWLSKVDNCFKTFIKILSLTFLKLIIPLFIINKLVRLRRVKIDSTVYLTVHCGVITISNKFWELFGLFVVVLNLQN